MTNQQNYLCEKIIPCQHEETALVAHCVFGQCSGCSGSSLDIPVIFKGGGGGGGCRTRQWFSQKDMFFQLNLF